jgi:hypothetical protein
MAKAVKKTAKKAAPAGGVQQALKEELTGLTI